MATGPLVRIPSPQAKAETTHQLRRKLLPAQRPFIDRLEALL